MSAPIIITGMHCSGTSLISSCLYKSGLIERANLNSLNTDSEDESSINEIMVSFQKKVLTAMVNDERKLTEWEPSLLDYKKWNSFIAEAKDISDSLSINNVWGWEDTQTVLLLDQWKKLFPDAKFILAYRDPWETYKCLLNDELYSIPEDIDLFLNSWLNYNKAILSFYQSNKDNCILAGIRGVLDSPEKFKEIFGKKFSIELSVEIIKESFKSERLSPGNLKLVHKINSDSNVANKLAALNEIADIPNSNIAPKISKDKIGILIPCFSNDENLEETLSGLASLPYFENLNIVIVNYGPADESTFNLAESFDVSHLQVIHEKEIALSGAKNLGIRHLHTELLLSLNPGDTISPGYITDAVKNFDNNNEIDIYYSNVHFLNEEYGWHEPEDYNIAKLLAFNFIGSAAIYRRKIWTEVNGYDEQITYGDVDWEFWIKAAKKGFSFFKSPMYFVSYNSRINSMKVEFNIEKRLEAVKYVVQKHQDIYSDKITEIHPFILSYLSDLEQNYYLLKKQSNDDGENSNNTQAQLTEEVFIAKYRQKVLEKQLKEIQEQSSAKSGPVSKIHRIFLKVERKIAGTGEIPFSVRLAKFFSKDGPKIIRKKIATLFRHLYLMFEKRHVKILFNNPDEEYSGIPKPPKMYNDVSPYEFYIQKYFPKYGDYRRYASELFYFTYQPLISIIIPTYNTDLKFFKALLESIENQVYSNWEVCIADDNSTDKKLKNFLEELDKKPKYSVYFRKKNGHISAASNSALRLAKGEFVALVDHDDLLTKDALFENVRALNINKNIDFIYSDEDKITEEGKFVDPHFKPDWSPDSLMCRNYITHLSVIRKSVVDKVDGFRIGMEGSQDHDLFLRIVEITDRIHHIPKVLYHWRIHGGSSAASEEVKTYAMVAGKKSVADALNRRGYEGEVLNGKIPGNYWVKYKPKKKEKVSIIIPTKDKSDILSVCLASIYEKGTYDKFEVIVVSNNSEEKETFDLFDKYRKEHPETFHWYEYNHPFNFSKLINYGFSKSSGDYLILLNNDIEVISEDWIECLLGYCQKPETGVVGCKLIYENETIQHAGVVVGLGGVAGHTWTGSPRNELGYFGYIQGVSNYTALTAACFMMRREVFEEVSGFGEEFTVDYNDIDFCLKVKDKGYYNVYLPFVELYHYESISRGSPFANKVSRARHIREKNLLLEKWDRYVKHDPHYSPNLSLGVHDFQFNG